VPHTADYMRKGCIIRHKIEISVKSGKGSTSTLSLVIHRVRFFKTLDKSTLAFKGVVETQKTNFFYGS
jgi:6-phosphogluconate dehydrogenase